MKKYIIGIVLLLPLSGFSNRIDTTGGVTAHRGNSGEFPENTIPAFQGGIDAGADWIELDIYRTKDGKIAVLHDSTTKRTGDKDMDIKLSTFAELQTIDVATDFRKRNGKTLEEVPVERIPLLEDVIKLVLKQHKTRVSIQPKMDCVADAMAIVRKLHAEKMVGFNDGNLQFMSQVKQLDPSVPVFWDRLPNTNIDEDIRIAKERGFESIVIYYKGVTPEKVQKLKAAGITPGAWTVDEREDLIRLLNMGVERIYTDYPKVLINVKKGS